MCRCFLVVGKLCHKSVSSKSAVNHSHAVFFLLDRMKRANDVNNVVVQCLRDALTFCCVVLIRTVTKDVFLSFHRCNKKYVLCTIL